MRTVPCTDRIRLLVPRADQPAALADLIHRYPFTRPSTPIALTHLRVKAALIELEGNR